MNSSIQDRLIMLVLFASKHKAYRYISYYTHTLTHMPLSEMFLEYAMYLFQYYFAHDF
jgi:hypothetical protein